LEIPHDDFREGDESPPKGGAMMRSIKLPALFLTLVWLNPGCSSDGANDDGSSDVAPIQDIVTTDVLSPSEEDASNVIAPGLPDSDGAQPEIPGSNYAGGWPTNPDKDSIEDPGWEGECPGGLMCECSGDEACDSNTCLDTPKGDYCAPAVGQTFPHFFGYDQYGEMVDIYDFGGQGKIIVLEMTTGWCAPCQELARWFLGIDNEVTERTWWKPEYEGIKNIVNSHKVLWVTIVYENHLKGPATQETAQQWAEAFPHEGVPVLADSNKAIHTWIKPSGIPNINLIDEDMTMMMYSNRGLTDAFDMLLELYGDSE
jgi:thiol-disulfide isomerase/thioredoxin